MIQLDQLDIVSSDKNAMDGQRVEQIEELFNMYI